MVVFSTVSEAQIDVQLSLDAIRLLVKMDRRKARRTLKAMLASSNPETRRLGCEYLRDLGDWLMTVSLCTKPKVATMLGLPDAYCELEKHFRNKKESWANNGPVVSGHLDIRNLDGPLVIPLSEAESINLAQSCKIELPNLRIIAPGFLNLVGASDISFPVMKKVEGYISARYSNDIKFQIMEQVSWHVDVRSTHAITFNKLTEIHGDLDARQAADLDLPSLTIVHGNVLVSNTEQLSMPRLKRIGGNLVARNSRYLSIPSLTKLDGNLNIQYCYDYDLPKIIK